MCPLPLLAHAHPPTHPTPFQHPLTHPLTPPHPIPTRATHQQAIDFSRRGLDGFDFARHNATPLAGLENLLPNAYTNALLQLLFYVPEVRAAVLRLQVRLLAFLACLASF